MEADGREVAGDGPEEAVVVRPTLSNPSEEEVVDGLQVAVVGGLEVVVDGPEVVVVDGLVVAAASARPTSSSLSEVAAATEAGREAEVDGPEAVVDGPEEAADGPEAVVARPTSSRNSQEEAVTGDGPEEVAVGRREVVASHTLSPRSAEAMDGKAKARVLEIVRI